MLYTLVTLQNTVHITYTYIVMYPLHIACKELHTGDEFIYNM